MMKNEKIQFLRGVAICAVVMIHTCTPVIYGVIIRAFVNFAVSMFLFLSGYLTKIDETEWSKIALKRAKRVFIPYLIWSLIWVVLSGNHEKLLVKLLTGGVIFPYYYVFVYIQFILVTPLIRKLLLSKYNWIGWFIQPIMILLLHYFGYSKYLHFSVFLSWFGPYYLGMGLGNKIYECNYSYKSLAISWLTSLFISIMEGLYWFRTGNVSLATTQLSLSNTLYSTVCLLIAYKFVNDNSLYPKRCISRLFVLLGDYSFGIYLTHIFVRTLLNRVSIYHYMIFPINFFFVLGIPAILIHLARKVISEKYGKYIGIY